MTLIPKLDVSSGTAPMYGCTVVNNSLIYRPKCSSQAFMISMQVVMTIHTGL